jgi:hypothetical protein
VANRGWPDRPGLYRCDYRSTAGEGQRWDLELRTSEPAVEVEIRADPGRDPRWAVAHLVDLETGTTTVLSTASAYRLVSLGSERPYRMALLAGSPEFVDREGARLAATPPSLVLDRNAPNPFRYATRLRFGLPTRALVDLAVFDVRGRMLTRLIDGRLPAGFHTAVWDGRDHRGRRAAAGVYFYRLVADGSVRTGRMAVLR